MKTVRLTRGKVALVDNADFHRVSQHKWYAFNNGLQFYAAHMILRPDGSRAVEFLHQFLLGIKGVDHRDGDGLNDQRFNLRPATHQQNIQGHRRKSKSATSQYRGVSWLGREQKWTAQITHEYKRIWLGDFKSEVVAARAYDKAARGLFGEFASPNFPICP